MLAAFRAFAKSWVAAILIGLLIVAFAIWGIRDVFRGRITDSVITAGSRTVTSAAFKRQFDAYKSRVEQQMGQPIPYDVAAANGLVGRVLQGLAVQEAFGDFLHKIGVRPSDKLVVSQIEKIQAFFDPVSGRFDKRSYLTKLSENGMTATQFEGEVRDQLADEQLGAGIANGLVIPRAYASLAAIFEMESRDVSYLTLGAQNVAKPPAPTDEQLAAFMKDNQARLTRPEFRTLIVVRFSPQTESANAPVDPAELKKRYDFRKDTLSRPETRTVVQIPAKDAAAAAQITARLGKGEAPDAVAKAVGVSAISYADKPKSAIPDQKVAAAAFAMAAGQTQTVQGDLGSAVVKVVAVTPGHVITLEEAKPMLEAEIRKDAVAEKINQQSQAYDDAHDKGASLPEAAKKAGVEPVTIGPVSQQGVGPDGKPVPGLNQKLMETAFGLAQGGESDLIDTGGGDYFAVKVDKITPPAMPNLAEVKPQMIQAWTMSETAKRLEAKADEVSGRLKKGETLQAVAASVGSKVDHMAGLSRRTAAQNPQISQELLGQAFNAKPGDVFVARGQGFALMVGKLDAIHAGEGPELAGLAEQARPQMTMAFMREIEEASRMTAARKEKITTDEARARAALGLEPAEKAPAKPGLAK
jgi:peptidyl-prolyl cis-trans isomerase D